MTSGRIPTRASVLAAYRAAATGGGSGLDITTTAGGDNMKVRAPDAGDTTDVTGAWPSSSSSIAVGNGTTIDNGRDVIAVGDGIDIAPIFTNTHISDVIAIGDGATVEIEDDGVAIGDGATCMYPTKPDDTPYAHGDVVGNATWLASTTAHANDMVSIGDGATCTVGDDAVAIGDGAVAVGSDEVIAIGSGISGTYLNSGGNPRRLRRVLPDYGCVVIGDGLANGKGGLALGASAHAGRDLTHQRAGNPMNYQQSTGLTAVGLGAAAGAQTNIDVAGVDNATALGAHAAAAHDHSTAVGADAATTADNQVMLGTAADTVVILGTLSAAGITGGGHAIAAADAGGVVQADVESLIFEGTAVTSVVDDGSGHVTVTVDQGSTGGGAALDVAQIWVNLVPPDTGGGFIFGYLYESIQPDSSGRHVAVTITTPPMVVPPGEGFSLDIYMPAAYAGSGTVTVAYVELDVTNLTCDEQMAVSTGAESALATGDTTPVYDAGVQVSTGSDLSLDGTSQNVISAAGGLFFASCIVEMYITP